MLDSIQGSVLLSYSTLRFHSCISGGPLLLSILDWVLGKDTLQRSDWCMCAFAWCGAGWYPLEVTKGSSAAGFYLTRYLIQKIDICCACFHCHGYFNAYCPGAVMSRSGCVRSLNFEESHFQSLPVGGDGLCLGRYAHFIKQRSVPRAYWQFFVRS